MAAGTGLGMSRQGIGGSTNDVAVVDNECKHLPECYLGQPESNTSIPERTGRNPELLEISIEEQDHLALTGSKVPHLNGEAHISIPERNLVGKSALPANAVDLRK